VLRALILGMRPRFLGIFVRMAARSLLALVFSHFHSPFSSMRAGWKKESRNG
jgi:hypothetical protein